MNKKNKLSVLYGMIVLFCLPTFIGKNWDNQDEVSLETIELNNQIPTLENKDINHIQEAPIEQIEESQSQNISKYSDLFRRSKVLADPDGNGLSDELTAKKNSGLEEDEFHKIICSFQEQPADRFYEELNLSNILTGTPWTEALYGFSATIKLYQIIQLQEIIQKWGLAEMSFIEMDSEQEANLYVTAKQMNARPYVWDTLGYKGDPNTSIAVIDTGIDDTHPNHYGYGDQDFNKKIVGWYDSTDLGSSTPIDDGSHGSHCAGIAAGSGFETIDGSNRIAFSKPYSMNLSGNSYTPGAYYLDVAYFNVTSAGTILVESDFLDQTVTGTSYVYGGFALFYGASNVEEQEYQASSSWSNRQLSHVVSSGNLGVYILKAKIYFGAGAGNCENPAFSYSYSWWAPYTAPSDSYPLWTGISPESKLMGIKSMSGEGSGQTSWIIGGIDYAIDNRNTYHITVASLSLGGSVFTMAQHLAVENAVDSGLVVVVSAGNSGSDANTVGQPGNADSIISVAALTYEDNVTSYSSRGGLSYTGNTIKPDISAPGGVSTFPMYSSDSNDQDGAAFSDQYANDSVNMQGTSMACPAVAGAANLVVDAMGGWSNWVYSRDQALSVKNILLMTASETNRLREDATSQFSPVLNRGEKDIDEGYGGINVDAAISALTQTASLGSTYQSTVSASTADVNQPHAWARNITLNRGVSYVFDLTVPSTLDCDLYLYSQSPDEYGEPIILVNSILPGNSNESITFTPSETGIYYIIIKAVSGNGQFSLDLSDHTVNDFASVWVSPSEGTATTRTITARLLDQSSVSVWANIEYYNGFFDEFSGEVITTCQLYDDGTHGDTVVGDGNFTNTLDISLFRDGKYLIDIICYDSNLGFNATYHQTGGGFWNGNDLENPDIFYVGATPNSVFQGETVSFEGRIYDTSNISSASVNIYDQTDTLIQTVPLYDDGAHNDNLMQDGYFCGTLATSSMTAQCYYYTVYATDNSGNSNQVVLTEFGYLNVTEQPYMGTLMDYNLNVNQTYSWITASTLLSGLTDDEFYTLSLNQSWSMPFYDANYSTVYINANGFLSFQTNSMLNTWYCQHFPSSMTSGPDTRKIIAPLWADLIVGAGGVYYTLTSSYLVVEWRNIQYYGGYTGGTFEVILYSNGTIKYQYDNMHVNILYVGAVLGVNYGSTSNLATCYYQFDQVVGTQKAVTLTYPKALDQCSPRYGLLTPRPDEKLYGNEFIVSGLLVNEALTNFEYRIYRYETLTHVNSWTSTVDWHTLQPGLYRLELSATDLYGNTHQTDYNFTMLGNLSTSIQSATPVNTNSINLTWSSAPNIYNYLIYRDSSAITPDKLDSLGVYQSVSNGTTNYVDSSITFDTTYHYAVIGNNSWGQCWLQDSLSSLVPDINPSAQFSANVTSLVAGQFVQFTDISSSLGNLPVTYQWDFDDGTGNVTTASPLHQFTSAGTRDVRLTVEDIDGDLSVYKMDISVATDLFPSAEFSANVSSLIVGQYVQFTDISSSLGNLPATYQWDFDDSTGNVTTASPLHQFTSGGTRDVRLTVEDIDGDLSVYNMEITVAADLFPSAEFSVNVSSLIADQYVQFTDISSSLGNLPATYQWNFNDSTGNVTTASPLHQFTSNGTYEVRLTVEDVDGDVSVYSMQINVDMKLIPSAHFLASAINLVAGQSVQFTDNSSLGNTPTTYQWNFNDGTGNVTTASPLHQFTSNGTYDVRLTIQDADGDISVYSMQITVIYDLTPTAHFSPSAIGIIIGQTVQFTNTCTSLGNSPITFQWNFGDGTGNVTTASPSHQFNSAGVFFTKLTIRDIDGDQSVYNVWITVAADLFPSAKFSSNVTSLIEGQYVQFLDTTTDFGNLQATHQWNFNDGTNNVTNVNPLHKFNISGTFDVRLTIKDIDGDISVYTMQITVVADLFPSAKFSTSSTKIIAGQSMQFNNISPSLGNLPATYSWDFGDGTPKVTTINPLHQFNTVGNFTVILTIQDKNGDLSTFITVIEVSAPAVQPEEDSSTITIIIGVAIGGSVVGVAMVVIKKKKSRGLF
jgi:PKD repeat protein/subtilisin family serine protease